MSAVAAPYGLRPVFHPSGLSRPMYIPNAVASGAAFNLFQNGVVNWVAAVSGAIAPVTTNAQALLGSWQGVFFVPTGGGRPTINNQWVSGAAYNTAEQMYMVVYTDPDMIYRVQSVGASNINILGGQVLLSTFNTGSTTTGISTGYATVATSVATTVQGQLRVMELSPEPTNAWGAGTGFNVDATNGAFTDLHVQIARGQYSAPVVSQ